MDSVNRPLFECWAVVELFGHTRLAGHITEATIAGGVFLRLDVPDANGETLSTHYYGHAAVYSINPVCREAAIAVAQHNRPVPVKSWEIPRPASLELQDKMVGGDPADHGEEETIY